MNYIALFLLIMTVFVPRSRVLGGNEVEREPLVVEGVDEPIRYARFTADSKSLAVMDGLGRIRFYDLNTRKFGSVKIDTAASRLFFLSPCGRYLLSESEKLEPKVIGQGRAATQDVLVLWDIKTGKILLTVPNGRQEPSAVPWFDPDGDRFYYVNPENGITIFDIPKKAKVGGFAAPPKPVFSTSLSLDGKWLAVSSQGVIDLWDTVKLERHNSFRVKDGRHRLAFLPDSKTLLSVGPMILDQKAMGPPVVEDRILRFDAATGKELESLPLPEPLRRGGIRMFQLSPNGQSGFLLSDFGGPLFLFDPRNGKEVGVGKTRLASFPNLLLSSDGKFLAGVDEGKLLLYPTDRFLNPK